MIFARTASAIALSAGWGLTVLTGPAAAQADGMETFTSAHVFDLEFADDPQLSPDGSTIVYVRKSMDRETDRVTSTLWSIDRKTGAHRPLLDAGEMGSTPRWSPDGERLAFISARDDKPDLKVLFLDRGRSFSLAQLQEGPSAPVWSADGNQIAFSMLVPSDPPSFSQPPERVEGAEWAPSVKVYDDVRFRADGQGYLTPGDRQIFLLSADGGSPRQLTEAPGGLSSPVWLDAETLVAVGNTAEDRDLDPSESELYAVSVEDGAIRALTEREGPDTSPAVSPDGSRIAFLGYDEGPKAHQQNELYLYDVETGETEVLTEEYDRAPGAPVWSPDGERLFALTETDGDLSIVSYGIDGERRVLTDRAGGTSLGRPYASGSFTVAATEEEGMPVLALTVASPDRPAEIGTLTGETLTKLDTLTRLNDDVLPFLDLAEIREMTVESSAGGLPVEAWVALPPGFEKDGSAPMILEIHGGPYAMYGPFFAAEIQRYAAEGYVTVYANPRGSTGYGQDFAQEIDLAYPGQDYTDLMSVVDALVAQDYVDPDRLFVTGGSGGGVLTAWIVGNTDRFAAAASIKPVINWATLALSSDIAAWTVRNWMRAMPWEDPDRYFELSPISKVGNVTTPTLMMVGEEDWRTPAWEAEQFYTALKLREVDTALVRIPGASHSIAARPSHLIAKVDTIMGWFAKYDPAKEEGEAQAASDRTGSDATD